MPGSPPSPAAPDTRHSSAWGYLTTNLGVLPGLGSVMAGRKVGWIQMPMALGGAVLSLWFGIEFVRFWLRTRMMPLVSEVPVFQGLAGIGLYATSWLWALHTSQQLIRDARKAPPVAPPPISSGADEAEASSTRKKRRDPLQEDL